MPYSGFFGLYLPQILNSNNVSNIHGLLAPIRNPNFQPCNLDLAPYIWIINKCGIIIIPKIMGQEKVFIGIVILGPKFKVVHRTSTLSHHRIALRPLFRKYGRNPGLPKLKFGLYPKKALCPCNQGTIKRHTNITYLYLLKYIILGWCIVQLDQILKIEGSLGIIIGRYLKSLPYFTQHT